MFGVGEHFVISTSVTRGVPSKGVGKMMFSMACAKLTNLWVEGHDLRSGPALSKRIAGTCLAVSHTTLLS